MSSLPSPELTPTRLSRIREIFDGALERSGAERKAYLDSACEGDPTLRNEVEEYLAALERGKETWDNPFGALLADAMASSSDEDAIGKRIGQYEIIRLIGYGGMGAVYEAVRADDQFRKHVAIKFLRRGIEGDMAIRRFRHERQILANLNHRNITSLLDGGVTVDGQPYIVMEYVDGVPITRYCNQRSLGVRARVALLRQVCAAVQHAHQNLVVHRDLKPGNILVTADGTVKLLDFGIARLLREQDGSDNLPMTQGAVRAYTPDYASPEQVLGLPVATASDIYSLGVIACELLTHHRPFALDYRNLTQLQDAILTRPAPLPSSLVNDGDALLFGERTAERVKSQLAGDIDAIILQALRKEPERRYASVEQLNTDLQHYLQGLPVTAQRDRLSYRVKKLVLRRKFESAAAALIVVLLVGGIISTTMQARRAKRERAVAELERAKAEEVNTFLANMLAAADPSNSGRDVTVVQVLEQAVKDVENKKLNPEIEAQIRHTIAQTYYGLGLYEEATGHAQRAYELRKQVFGELDFHTTTSLSYVVALAEARGDYAIAESLAKIHVDLQRRMPTPDPTELATALDNLARVIEHQGRLAEVMPIKKESIALRRLKNDTAARAAISYTLNNLSVSYQYQGDYVTAESLASEAIGIEGELHGRRSFAYGSLLRNYASILDELGRRREADSVIRESLDVMREVAGPEHTEYLRSLNMHAQLLYAAGDMRAAAIAAREVARQIGKGIHESEPASASTLQVLGLALDSIGEFAGADSALRRSLAIRRKYLPPEHWAIASSESVLGYHLGKMGKFAEAERIMSRAYEKLVESRGADAQVTKRVAVRLAELMERQKRTADAAKWRSRG